MFFHDSTLQRAKVLGAFDRDVLDCARLGPKRSRLSLSLLATYGYVGFLSCLRIFPFRVYRHPDGLSGAVDECDTFRQNYK